MSQDLSHPCRSKHFSLFRLTFPEFVYNDFQYEVQPDGLHLVFHFLVIPHGSGQPISFAPDAFIPNRPFLSFHQPKPVLDALVFNIGMVELVSYWKAYCPPLIRVACGSLDEAQVAFWKKLYFNGLGEFFFTNGIHTSLDDFVTIVAESPSSSVAPLLTHFDTTSASHYLVPIGGGKDSVVTLEAIRHCGVTPLIMNPRGATTQCVEAAGFTMEQTLVIRRSIDARLLQANAQGALNGHTPFSAMLAFYSLLASQLSGVPNIALSNENSANESTVVGTAVNHQYSKSLEYENDFRAYVARFLSPDYNYFSFLRPLSELQIAMLFARHDKYFDVFKSCNVGSKQDVWCGHCAKCLFAFIILSPFIHPDRLSAIFGKNMLDDPALRLFFDQLTGQAPVKPFECVGTIDEVNAALCLALKRWYTHSRPALLADYCCPSDMSPLAEYEWLHHFYPDNNLNTSLSLILRHLLDA